MYVCRVVMSRYNILCFICDPCSMSCYERGGGHNKKISSVAEVWTFYGTTQ